MQLIHGLLESVLAANGLSSPDGRALYAYDVSDEHLKTLRELLQRSGHRARRFDRFESAAFCLHAAYSFCMDHIGGAWAWATVTESIGLEPTHAVIAELTVEGLGWWHLPVLPVNDRRQFLVTLACQGGLPRSLLARDGVHLRVYYARLLADREQYTATPIEALVARHEHLLPTTLRNDIVRELSAKLIDRIASLRKLVSESENPLTVLDERYAGWRDTIPLRLADSLAFDLLRGLLTYREVRSSHAAIRVTGYLRETLSGWVFAREADIPTEMSGTDLAHQLDLSEEDLPPGFALHLRSSNGMRHRIAVATKLADGSYRIEATRQQLRWDNTPLLDTLRLVAISNGKEFLGCVPAGGERIDGLPWVCATDCDAEGRYPLIGVASVQTNRTSVIVAVPESIAVTPSNSIVEIGTAGLSTHRAESAGPVSSPTVEPYKIYLVEGQMTVGTDNGKSYSIETNADADVVKSCVLVGACLPLGFGGSDVWCGIPSVEIREGGIHSIATVHDIEWRPLPGPSPWQTMTKCCVGDVELRISRRGKIVGRLRATVLPSRTSVTLRPGPKPGGGTIVIDSADVREVTAGIALGVTAETRPLEGRIEVDLIAEDHVPSTIPLWLELGQGRRATLEVPFPAVAAMFIDAEGVVLPANAEVAVDSLFGMRVQVVTPSASGACHLTGCLHGNVDDKIHLEGLHACRRDLAALTPDGLGRHVLLLDDIHDAVRQLLATSTDLDAVVVLRVEFLGGTPTSAARRELHIKRYDAWFERTRHGEEPVSVTVPERIRERIGGNAIEKLRVEAFPILAPDAAHVELERIGDRWAFDRLGQAEGPWFVLGTQGLHVRFRPLLLTFPSDEAEEAPDSLRARMRIEGKPERRLAIDESIVALAADAGHPDWPLLWHQLRQLETLPPTTYDSVDRLVRNANAVALAILSASNSLFHLLFTKLEELPHMWPLVPLRSWLRAVEVIRRKYEAKSKDLESIPGGWNGVFTQTIRDRLTHLTERSRWFQNVWDLVAEFVPDVAPPEARPISHVKTGHSLLELIQNERDDMRRRHANDKYPSAKLSEVLLRVPSPYRERLAHHPEPGCGYEADVLNAPLVASAASVFAFDVPRPALFDIARMRDFDRYGFDYLYEILQAEIAGERLRFKGERFDDINA